MPAASPRPFRFPRAARIQQSREFNQLRQHGQRLAVGCLVANWRRLSPGATSRLGVVTSRKVGNSVVRSRARRLLRETFRLHTHDLAEPVDLVLVARPSIAGKRRNDVEHDFLTALRRARLLKPDAENGSESLA